MAEIKIVVYEALESGYIAECNEFDAIGQGASVKDALTWLGVRIDEKVQAEKAKEAKKAKVLKYPLESTCVCGHPYAIHHGVSSCGLITGCKCKEFKMTRQSLIEMIGEAVSNGEAINVE